LGSLNTFVQTKLKHPAPDWLKSHAPKEKGSNANGRKQFSGLGISIALILLGMFGLPIFVALFLVV
jgi:hypothetical protein